MTTASIVTYNHSLYDIEQALTSLLQSDVSHVFIIDHSDKGSKEFEAELTAFGKDIVSNNPEISHKCRTGRLTVTYHKHENIGYGGGHNVAIRMAADARSKYHVVVNPDVCFEKDVISSMRDYMDSHEDVGQMMPKVLFPDGTIQRLCKLLPTPFDMISRLCLPPFINGRRNNRYELRKSGYDKIMNVPYLSGCFMFFRMSALEKVGLFDEDFFMYSEDIDMTRRMHRQYKTLFFPHVTIYHKFSRASRHSIKLLYIHIKNIFMYFNKYGWLHDEERTAVNKITLEECGYCS